MKNLTQLVIIGSLCLSIAACSSSEPKIDAASNQEGTTAETADKGHPEINPWLAHEKLATTHFDMRQSDNFPMPVKEGAFNIDPTQVKRVAQGPINIITLQSTQANHWWGLSTAGVAYIDGSDGKWEAVSSYQLPNVAPLSIENLDHVLGTSYDSPEALAVDYDKYWAPSKAQNPTIRMITGNSVYAVVDKDNFLYLTAAGQVFKMAFENGSVKMVANMDVKSKMAIPEELKSVIDINQIPGGITGVNMTYDGHLVVGTIFGLMVIDRDLSTIKGNMAFPMASFYSNFPPKKGETPEFISNSFAIDMQNAIYVATGSTMNKVAWTGTELSMKAADGAWSESYSTGDYAPTIKYGKGTGSTPTLMGNGVDNDGLVVITDGQNRMNLVAFWRKVRADGNQIADQIEVQCGYEADDMPDFIQSEQSVAVLEDGAFVVNNIAPSPEGLRDFDQVNKVGDLVYNVLAIGPIVQPGQGIERFKWNNETHKWQRVWAHPAIASTSMVPAISSTSRVVCVNTYNPEKGWQVVGFNWETGEVVQEVTFGKTSYGNGAYALIEYFENGDLLFNGIGGPMRIELE